MLELCLLISRGHSLRTIDLSDGEEEEE